MASNRFRDAGSAMLPSGNIDFIDENPASISNQARTRSDLANANINETTAQYAQPVAQARLRTINAGATTAETEAKYAEPMAKANVRQHNAAALNSEMQGFYKSLDLLNAGDIEGAHAVAQATGQKIPQTVIDSADVRAAVTQYAKQAQAAYPNRPQDQQTYIRSGLTEMAKRTQAGGPASSPTAPYEVPNAPAPQETNKTGGYQLFQQQGSDVNGKAVTTPRRFNQNTGELEDIPNAQPGEIQRPGSAGGAGGGGQTERIIAELRKADPKLTYAEALALSKRAPNGDAITLQRERIALNAAKADVNYLTNPDATIEKYRKKYGLGAPAVPTSPPPPPAQSVPPAPSQAPAVTPPAAPVQTTTPPPAANPQYDQEASLAAARDALARNPAARDQIIQRLIENGIDPAGL